MMNSPFVVEQAQRLVAAPGDGRERRTLREDNSSFTDSVFAVHPSQDESGGGPCISSSPKGDGGQRRLVWQYGYGPYDESAHRVAQLHRAAVFHAAPPGRAGPVPDRSWIG